MKKILLHLPLFLLLLLFANCAIAQSPDSLSVGSIPYVCSWVVKPMSFSIKNNALTIVAGPKTDMFRDPNVTYNTDNAPKLLFVPDQNFVLSSSIQHSFSSKWDGGAIVLMEDSLHWIKFCFEKDYTGARRVVSVVTKDISDDCNSAEIAGNKVYYKIARADNVITLYYSIDSKNWLLIRHLQFNAVKPIRIGFLAQSPLGEKCEVHFDDINYESKKISDPYTGE